MKIGAEVDFPAKRNPASPLRQVSRVMMNGKAHCEDIPAACRTCASMPIPYLENAPLMAAQGGDNPRTIFHHKTQIIRRGKFAAHIFRRLDFGGIGKLLAGVAHTSRAIEYKSETTATAVGSPPAPKPENTI